MEPEPNIKKTPTTEDTRTAEKFNSAEEFLKTLPKDPKERQEAITAKLERIQFSKPALEATVEEDRKANLEAFIILSDLIRLSNQDEYGYLKDSIIGIINKLTEFYIENRQLGQQAQALYPLSKPVSIYAENHHVIVQQQLDQLNMLHHSAQQVSIAPSELLTLEDIICTKKLELVNETASRLINSLSVDSLTEILTTLKMLQKVSEYHYQNLNSNTNPSTDINIKTEIYESLSKISQNMILMIDHLQTILETDNAELKHTSLLELIRLVIDKMETPKNNDDINSYLLLQLQINILKGILPLAKGKISQEDYTKLAKLIFEKVCDSQHNEALIDSRRTLHEKRNCVYSNNVSYIDERSSTYNANCVSPRHFIAEGPKNGEAVCRFFANLFFNASNPEMLNASDIIVVGDAIEFRRRKYEDYFVSPAFSTYDYKDLSLTITPIRKVGKSSDSKIDHYDLLVTMSKGENTVRKIITVHHVTEAIDHSVPTLTAADFKTLLAIHCDSKNYGLVSHCSAGLGRSGLIELAFYLYNTYDKYFDEQGNPKFEEVTKALEEFRTIRPRTIQGNAQGLFAIEIAQKLKACQRETLDSIRDMESKNDADSITTVLNYYREGKPVVEDAETRNKNFQTWANRILEVLPNNSPFQSTINNELKLALIAEQISKGKPPIHPDRIIEMAKQNPQRFFDNNELSRALGFEGRMQVLLSCSSSDVIEKLVNIDGIKIQLNQYALLSLENARQCLMNTGLNDHLDIKRLMETHGPEKLRMRHEESKVSEPTIQRESPQSPESSSLGTGAPVPEPKRGSDQGPRA